MYAVFFSQWMASQQNKEQLHEFISGLGPGQLVGRQVLGSPVLGDIQLSLVDKRGNLEVEVIRARGLQSKPGSKILPAPWVKVYLVSGKKCLAKAKTGAAPSGWAQGGKIQFLKLFIFAFFAKMHNLKCKTGFLEDF